MVEVINCGMFYTNTYVISKNGKCIIIDPTLDFYKESLKIREKYEVLAIFITHAHIDHIDGIRYFPNVDIYISSRDYQNMNDEYTLYESFRSSIPFNIDDYNVHTLDGGEVVKLDDFEVKVILTPGHTLGGMCFYIDDALFTGDTLFKGTCGRTDFPGGCEKDIILSIKKIIETFSESTIVYPGHDSATTIGFEKRYNPCYRKA